MRAMPSADLAVPFELRIPPRADPTAEAVVLDLVIHAPDRSGAAALCGRATQPDRILASGPASAVDCPGCVAAIGTDDGMRDAVKGATLARERLHDAYVQATAGGAS